MNVLFLTLLDFDSVDEHNIYKDLLGECVKHKHKTYVISSKVTYTLTKYYAPYYQNQNPCSHSNA